MSAAKQNLGILGLHKRYWENDLIKLRPLEAHSSHRSGCALLSQSDSLAPNTPPVSEWRLSVLSPSHTLCTDCFSPWLLLIFNTLLVCSTNQPNQTYYNPHSTRFIPFTKSSLTILVLRNTNHLLPHLASCKVTYRLFCTMCSIVLMVYMDSPIQL